MELKSALQQLHEDANKHAANMVQYPTIKLGNGTAFCCNLAYCSLAMRTLKFLCHALRGFSHWIFVAVLVRAAFAACASACVATALTSFTTRKIVAESILTADSACRNAGPPTATVACSAQVLGSRTSKALDALIVVALGVSSHRVLVASGRSHAAFAACIHACITAALTAFSAAEKIAFVVLAARPRRASIPAAFVLRRAPKHIVLVVEARPCTLQFRYHLRHW